MPNYDLRIPAGSNAAGKHDDGITANKKRSFSNENGRNLRRPHFRPGTARRLEFSPKRKFGSNDSGVTNCCASFTPAYSPSAVWK